jgi:hypothetical protein
MADKIGSSATALIVLGGVLTLVGGMIASPDGRLFFLALAVVILLIVVIFQTGRRKRIIALVILVAAVLQIIPAWQEAVRDRKLPGNRSHQAPIADPAKQ